MNIKMLNAHLKMLGPAPKGMKWKMYKHGEKMSAGGKVLDIPKEMGGGGHYEAITMDGSIANNKCSIYPHMRFWHLVPIGPKPPKEVRIEVSGGVAECVSCPKGIKVVIYDHDNAKEVEDGEKYEPDVTIGS